MAVVLAALVAAAACSRAPATSGAADATVDREVTVALAVPGARSTPDAGAEAGADAATLDDDEHDDEPDGGAPVPSPFGAAQRHDGPLCGGVLYGSGPKYVTEADARTFFVDGDDPFALANRSPTGTLPPSFAPSDLVDVAQGKPRTKHECDQMPCLRKEAREALQTLLAQMKAAGHAGHLASAYRGYAVQCATFQRWAKESSFCAATEQSALPGHSQHQLGTTIDLFTEAWAQKGMWREGFGCNDGGSWLQEHAREQGFVFPYPLHPDDRRSDQACRPRADHRVSIHPKTGYRYEHWHLRFVGRDAAKAFHEAWKKSVPGSPNELTLEQWLRQKRKLPRDVDTELPVCDGCNCGACATLSPADKRGPCGDAVLHLAPDGRPVGPGDKLPTLVEATIEAATKKLPRRVRVVLELPPETLTSPPVIAADVDAPGPGVVWTTYTPWAGTTPRKQSAPRGTVRLAAGPRDEGGEKVRDPWPVRASLASSAARIWNGARVVLPARRGRATYELPVVEGAREWAVGLEVDGKVRELGVARAR